MQIRLHQQALALLLLVIDAPAAMLYVDLNSTNPTPPYSNWITAANHIQDAVDSATPGDTILVTNGLYQTGGRVVHDQITNRVAVFKPLVVRSVNGPAVTIIKGTQPHGSSAVRCAYLTNGASITGFTLTNGGTGTSGDQLTNQCGGGVWCESTNSVVSNCILAGNSAYVGGGGAYNGLVTDCIITNNSADAGGGAYMGSLKDCVFIANSASYGGGAANAFLDQCVLKSNTATAGGGVIGGVLTNCLLNGNIAADSGGGVAESTVNNCVLINNRAGRQSGAGVVGLTPGMNNCLILGNSAGSFAGAGIGTFRNCTIVSNSAPQGGGVYESEVYNCILLYNSASSGTNHIYSTLNYCCTTPLPTDGNGNINFAPLFIDLVGGNFRLQTNSPCSNAGNNADALGNADLDGRLRLLGGTVDIGAYEVQGPGIGEFIGWLQQYGIATDGSADFGDSDGEGMNNWQEWICGTNPTNSLSVLKIQAPSTTASGIKVSWQSASGKSYDLQRSTNLLAQAAFSSIQSNIVGQAGTTTFTDTNATGTGPYFYRIGVQQ